MTTSAPPPSLRVLCLHDNDESASILHRKLHLLDKRLYKNHGIELIYVNSPLRAGPRCDDDDESSEQQRHVWWEEEENDDDKTQYVGLDASLLHLRQIYNTMPFQGILAEGSGCAVASLCVLSNSMMDLEFGVFLNGTTLLQDENERLVVDWPCLHIVDSCPNDDTDKLIRQFGGQVHNIGGERLTTDDLNVLGKFLVEQKNRLYNSCSATNNDDNRLVLQNQLHLVEQQAARVFAEQTAKNPPKALMAVISPQTQTFGAWSGSKAPKPGGGAPCPPEFLLKRQQRSNKNDGGPSREHPDNHVEEESEQSAKQDI